MIRANGFTVRYGTSFDMPTGSDIAPRQLTLKSNSSGTIYTSVMYAAKKVTVLYRARPPGPEPQLEDR